MCVLNISLERFYHFFILLTASTPIVPITPNACSDGNSKSSSPIKRTYQQSFPSYASQSANPFSNCVFSFDSIPSASAVAASATTATSLPSQSHGSSSKSSLAPMDSMLYENATNSDANNDQTLYGNTGRGPGDGQYSPTIAGSGVFDYAGVSNGIDLISQFSDGTHLTRLLTNAQSTQLANNDLSHSENNNVHLFNLENHQDQSRQMMDWSYQNGGTTNGECRGNDCGYNCAGSGLGYGAGCHPECRGTWSEGGCDCNAGVNVAGRNGGGGGDGSGFAHNWRTEGEISNDVASDLNSERPGFQKVS